jgi:TatD DNase family protein
MYTDFHTHKPIFSSNPNVLEVISMHKTMKYENEYFTVGHHPWWTEAPLLEEDLLNLEILLSNKFCLGIGECGLDKLKGASKEIQEEVFYQHIMLANKHNVPLIIHCVRQYDQVINFRKKYGKTPWVIHGFRRNKQLAKSLIDQGIMVSASPFENMNDSFVEMLKTLPSESYFIETDSEYTLNIMERYQIMANLRKVDLEDLKEQMMENFNAFFAWKGVDFFPKTASK